MTLQADDTPFVIPPDRLDPLVEGDNATERFYAFLEDVADRLPLEGNGEPEGSVTANTGRLYIDKSGTQGNRIYFKTTDGTDTGWELA